MTLHFSDTSFLYVWKPHGVPSTFGKQSSFLDTIVSMDFFVSQIQVFSIDEEYGLLNRLDNDTAWLLYFARTKKTYTSYMIAQDNWSVIKHYIAAIAGKPHDIPSIIAYPVAHHHYHDDRMIVRVDSNDNADMRGQWHSVETCIENLWYNESTNITWLHVMISKGMRHQIRAHMASVGLPIIGEKIYKKNKDTRLLHLWSVWLTVDL